VRSPALPLLSPLRWHLLSASVGSSSVVLSTVAAAPLGACSASARAAGGTHRGGARCAEASDTASKGQRKAAVR